MKQVHLVAPVIQPSTFDHLIQREERYIKIYNWIYWKKNTTEGTT